MESWARVRQVFEQLVDMKGSEREDRLQLLCGEDAALRAEVLELLAKDESTIEAAIQSGPLVEPLADPSSLRQIGSYQLVRVVGSGGMGTVFEARQERPARTVALKVLRTMVASESARRRLEYEAETLGRLQHPNVAQIHESGTWNDPDTGEAMPFFAMEYVADARKITDYADAARLGLAARIELFLPVCDAVHHGHQQGVLHRDLKPANILVGSEGLPKVIDFGIARATDMADDGRAVRTLTGQVLGTPGYMSPEQIEGDARKIDVRADVYGLAATLHELLVGTPPHDRGEESLGVFLRRLRDEVPRRPSMIGSSTVAVPADLDWVLLRALAPEAGERYPSVSEFAADLRRFLNHEPLFARPPTRGYLLRKFVRRYRLAVAASSTVLVALVAGTIATAIGWSRAVEARESANQMASELVSLTNLQGNILMGSRGNRGALLVDVIDRASAQLERRPPGSDRVAAGLHEALGLAYHDLGFNERALKHFEAAIERVTGKPSLHDSWLEVKSSYTKVLHSLGRLEEAEAIAREMLAAKLEAYGADHWRTAGARVQLAVVLGGRNQHREALPLLRRALPVLQEHGEVELPQIASTLTALAISLHGVGEDEEAESRYRQARALLEAEFGPRDPQVLSIRNSRAVLLLDVGQIDEAEPLLRELWEVNQEVSGPAHSASLRCAANLAVCFERLEKYPEAEAIYREVLGIRRAAEVPLEVVDLVTRFNLCVALHRQPGPAKLADALVELESLLADSRELLPIDGWHFAVFRQHRGIVFRKLERFAEAEADYEAARTVLEERLGPEHSRTQSNYKETAVLYETWGRPDDAELWRAKLTKPLEPTELTKR